MTTPEDRQTQERCIVELPIDSVVRAPGEWPRLELDRDRVAYFRDVFDDLPPIVVEEQSRRLIDGWHRLEAAAALGRDRIAAEVVPAPNGVLAASLAYATRAAKPLTRADRRHAIALLLRGDPRRSDRWLASIVGVSASTVAAVRSELEAREELQAPDVRLGRDGRERQHPRPSPQELTRPPAEPEIDGYDPYDEDDEPVDVGSDWIAEVGPRAGASRQPASEARLAPPAARTVEELDEAVAARRYLRDVLDQLSSGLERYSAYSLIELLRQGLPGYPHERAVRIVDAWQGILAAAIAEGG